MSARDIDRLAALIRQVDGNHDLGAAALAEAIVAAGWRPPAQTAYTLDDVRALPSGTVVRAGADSAAIFEKVGPDDWRTPGQIWPVIDLQVVVQWPLTVIHEGGAS